MSSTGLCSALIGFSDATGIAGNMFAFALFLSPIPTFRRIIRSRSTEQFSGLPYIYALLNCLICLWYGMPIVSPEIILIATVNSIGAVFQFIYIIIFVLHADKERKLKMSGLLAAVLAIFAAIVFASLKFFESRARHMFVGYLSVFSLISMFASPLSVINMVFKSRSVEFMPFHLSLATFLMSASFFAYGLSRVDLFIYVPNGIGTVLGVIQLVLYFYYSSKCSEDSKEPFLESYVA